MSALSTLRAQLSLLGKMSPSRSRWPSERSRYMARCCCALSKTRNSHSLANTRAICVPSLPILCYLYVEDSLNPSYARMAHSSHSAAAAIFRELNVISTRECFQTKNACVGQTEPMPLILLHVKHSTVPKQVSKPTMDTNIHPCF